MLLIKMSTFFYVNDKLEGMAFTNETVLAINQFYLIGFHNPDVTFTRNMLLAGNCLLWRIITLLKYCRLQNSILPTLSDLLQ